ncbi:type IX secretion system periplasmic lipoprotein PorW/SprE [Polaribacter sp.]|uniref:type IX secretion system periplasmic lipoprotein PorW/SprE n=1 Tax=Polaribacter sp. TaxID=1920175 RepID=UPI0040472B24
MKNAKIILVFSFFLVLAIACGTKKNTFVSRNYQALTTKYNVLFNGQEALNTGIQEINTNYKDDWFQRLPIEPIEFEEKRADITEFGLGAGFDTNENDTKKTLTTFDKAEEKAVKAIQVHKMNIDGLERNRQIDDAYLLLGKSRYYQQRFIPAIEAFNYVIANYPNANLIADTKIWRAKSEIRVDNEERAIETLKLLLVVRDTLEANLPDETKENGYTTLAMAYIKSDSIQKAKESLLLATRTLKNRDQAARNLFILGQLFAEENKKDSAAMQFKKLINFNNAPERYKIHAEIELAKNAINDSMAAISFERIQKLIKNRDNRPYLDALYYQKGVLNEQKDSVQLAISDYNNSLRAPNGDEKQRTFTYEKLGNLHFKKSDYQYASAYFDSVLQISKDTLDLRIRRIKRKQKSLISLIQYENIITKNDSILRLAALSKDDQKAFFEKYIEKIKKEDEAAAQLRLNQLAFGNNNTSLASANQGKWYFYNTQSTSFGATEFRKTWGNRKLEDDWRWAEKAKNAIQEKEITQVNQKNERYDLDSYINKIPTEKVVIDSLYFERNQALYELGLIYKEQFNNPKLAKERLERVASLQPAEDLILPINWHLYQLETTLQNPEKAAVNKNLIISKFPDTKFAQLLLNPDAKIQDEVAENEVETKYKELYYAYKESKYDEVISAIDVMLPTISNADLLPKFELLKAYAIGKSKDKETYKKALEFVSVNYGTTEEGKKAKAILSQLEKKSKD